MNCTCSIKSSKQVAAPLGVRMYTWISIKTCVPFSRSLSAPQLYMYLLWDICAKMQMGLAYHSGLRAFVIWFKLKRPARVCVCVFPEWKSLQSFCGCFCLSRQMRSARVMRFSIIPRACAHFPTAYQTASSWQHARALPLSICRAFSSRALCAQSSRSPAAG